MSSHTVVFLAGPSSQTGSDVAERLRAGGVTIVDQPPALRHFTEKRASAAGRMIEA